MTLAQHIKILFILNNLKQSDIAKKYRFDKGDVSKVISGIRRQAAIQNAICYELNMPKELVFKQEFLRTN